MKSARGASPSPRLRPVKSIRDRARGVIRGTRWWQPYQRWRHRRVLRATLGEGHQRRVHDDRVHQLQERERFALSEENSGVGSSPEELAAFFDAFHVIDPGIPLVRVGPTGDGGYLMPDDLDGIEACFSPGVAGEIGFDMAIADRGIPVHMIDRSVEGLPVEHDGIDFEPLFLGARSRRGWTSLTDWVARRAPGSSDLLLEMDIEGAEWAVLLTTESETLRRFRIIVLELHDLHLLSKRSNLHAYGAAFDKLLEDFELVHVHPNNHEYPVPYLGFAIHPVVEATFLRKDRIRVSDERTRLAHPLDSANTSVIVDYALDPRWR